MDKVGVLQSWRGGGHQPLPHYHLVLVAQSLMNEGPAKCNFITNGGWEQAEEGRGVKGDALTASTGKTKIDAEVRDTSQRQTVWNTVSQYVLNNLSK